MYVNRARLIDGATLSSSSKLAEDVITVSALIASLVSTRAAASNDVPHRRNFTAPKTCSRMSGEIRHSRTLLWREKLIFAAASSRCESFCWSFGNVVLMR